MEYLLIIILQLIGIAAHAFQKIAIIRKNHPEKHFNLIVQSFWFEDWNTLAFSVVVGLPLDLVGHYIVLNYGPDWIIKGEYYELSSFGLALLIGYAGQRLIYKYLGTAENYLDKQVANKLS